MARTIWYVNPVDGDDANGGTSASDAKRTWAGVSTVAANNGDTIAVVGSSASSKLEIDSDFSAADMTLTSGTEDMQYVLLSPVNSTLANRIAIVDSSTFQNLDISTTGINYCDLEGEYFSFRNCTLHPSATGYALFGLFSSSGSSTVRVFVDNCQLGDDAGFEFGTIFEPYGYGERSKLQISFSQCTIASDCNPCILAESESNSTTFEVVATDCSSNSGVSVTRGLVRLFSNLTELTSPVEINIQDVSLGNGNSTVLFAYSDSGSLGSSVLNNNFVLNVKRCSAQTIANVANTDKFDSPSSPIMYVSNNDSTTILNVNADSPADFVGNMVSLDIDFGAGIPATGDIVSNAVLDVETATAYAISYDSVNGGRLVSTTDGSNLVYSSFTTPIPNIESIGFVQCAIVTSSDAVPVKLLAILVVTESSPASDSGVYLYQLNDLTVAPVTLSVPSGEWAQGICAFSNSESVTADGEYDSLCVAVTDFNIYAFQVLSDGTKQNETSTAVDPTYNVCMIAPPSQQKTREVYVFGLGFSFDGWAVWQNPSSLADAVFTVGVMPRAVQNRTGLRAAYTQSHVLVGFGVQNASVPIYQPSLETYSVDFSTDATTMVNVDLGAIDYVTDSRFSRPFFTYINGSVDKIVLRPNGLFNDPYNLPWPSGTAEGLPTDATWVDAASDGALYVVALANFADGSCNPYVSFDGGLSWRPLSRSGGVATNFTDTTLRAVVYLGPDVGNNDYPRFLVLADNTSNEGQYITITIRSSSTLSWGRLTSSSYGTGENTYGANQAAVDHSTQTVVITDNASANKVWSVVVPSGTSSGSFPELGWVPRTTGASLPVGAPVFVSQSNLFVVFENQLLGSATINAHYAGVGDLSSWALEFVTINGSAGTYSITNAAASGWHDAIVSTEGSQIWIHACADTLVGSNATYVDYGCVFRVDCGTNGIPQASGSNTIAPIAEGFGARRVVRSDSLNTFMVAGELSGAPTSLYFREGGALSGAAGNQSAAYPVTDNLRALCVCNDGVADYFLALGSDFQSPPGTQQVPASVVPLFSQPLGPICVGENSLILLENGDTVRIRDVKPGMRVKAYNSKTHKRIRGGAEVLRIMKRKLGYVPVKPEDKLMVVPKGAFGKDQPMQDTVISGPHRIVATDRMSRRGLRHENVAWFQKERPSCGIASLPGNACKNVELHQLIVDVTEAYYSANGMWVTSLHHKHHNMPKDLVLPMKLKDDDTVNGDHLRNLLATRF